MPILPEKLSDYLYSPVNFIYGFNIKNKNDVYEKCNESICIVDLDNNRVECGFTTEDNLQITKTFPVPHLPEHYGKKLTKRVATILSKAGAGKSKPPKLAQPRLDEFSTKKIREAFFQFFVSIFKSYKKFLNYE